MSSLPGSGQLARTLAVCAVFLSAAASAQPAEPEGGPREARPQEEAQRQEELPARWSPLVALTPPAFGIAHFAGGAPRTGRRILGGGVLGLGLTALGGTGLIVTGASRKSIGIIAPIALTGVSLFMFSALADLAGSIARGRLPEDPRQRVRLRLHAGLFYAHDPQFNYGAFADVGVRGRYGRTESELRARIATDHNNQRIEGFSRYFFHGAARRGDQLFVRGELAYHRFGNEGFRHLTGSLSLGGRWMLSHVGPSLRGFFIGGELGIGLQGFGFEATGRGVSETTNALLVFESQFGALVGDRGEVMVFYNHRRDGFEGAMSLDSVAAGNVGYVGARGQGYFRGGPFGLLVETHYGSAWTTRVALLWSVQ